MADPKLVQTPSGTAELKARFIRDIRLAAIDSGLVTDVSIAPGSDYDLIGTASANLGMVAINNMALAADDASIFTATGDGLDRKREDEGLPVVEPDAASGKLVLEVLGPTTVVDGTQFIYPNGVRGKVVGTYVNPPNNSEVDVVSDSVGESTNLAAGTEVRFVSPPINVATIATVSKEYPITGGTDAEGDERKRRRILNKRRNIPAGGNWAHVRQLVLDEVGGVQDVFSYPALGGPSSAKVAVVKRFDRKNRDWTRSVSDTVQNRVRGLLFANLSLNDDTVIDTVADQRCDVTLQVRLPSAASSGGNSSGWVDSTVWPPLVPADSGRVDVIAYNNLTLLVGAQTTTAPIAGQTNIAWFSPADQAFYSALVTGVSGGSGTWILTLASPLYDKDGAVPQPGDIICPAAKNLGSYAKEWVNQLEKLGPGENTADPGILPRAKRHPYTTDEFFPDVTSITIGNIAARHPEITNWAFASYNVLSPDVPSLASDSPNCLVPGDFGIYPE